MLERVPDSNERKSLCREHVTLAPPESAKSVGPPRRKGKVKLPLQGEVGAVAGIGIENRAPAPAHQGDRVCKFIGPFAGIMPADRCRLVMVEFDRWRPDHAP